MMAGQNWRGYMSQEIKEPFVQVWKSVTETVVCKLGATNAKSNVVNAGIIARQVKFISHVQE